MLVFFRLLCFGILGALLASMDCSILSWKFWVLIILMDIVYICGRLEESEKQNKP